MPPRLCVYLSIMVEWLEVIVVDELCAGLNVLQSKQTHVVRPIHIPATHNTWFSMMSKQIYAWMYVFLKLCIKYKQTLKMIFLCDTKINNFKT